MAILAFIITRRVGKVIDKSVVLSFVKSLAGAVLTGAAAWQITLLGNWQAEGVTMEKVPVLAASVASGVAVYLISSLVKRSEEAGYLARVFLERRGRK